MSTGPPGRLIMPSGAWLHKPEGRNLKIIEKLIESGDTTPRTLFYFANELYENNRVAESITEYEKYLKVASEPWQKYYAMRRLSSAYRITANEENAQQCLRHAVDEFPERAEAYVELGALLFKLNKIDQAIELFSRATELKIPRTNFVDVYSYGWLPYDYLSACYLAKQEHTKALEAAIAAHERYPRDARLEANIDFLRKLAGTETRGGQ